MQVLLQRPRQRRLVDHRPARRVDQIRRSLHARQRPLVDQVPRLGRQRHVQRNDVRRVQQAIERHRLAQGTPVRLPRRRRVRCTPRASRMPALARRRRGRSGRSRSSPSCLPRSSVPSMKSNAQPFHSPRRTSRSPSDSRRVIARISAHVKSATDSVSTSGVLVTIDAARPRVARRRCCCSRRPRSRSTFSCGAASITVRSIASVEHADQRVLVGDSRAAARPAESALRRVDDRRPRPPASLDEHRRRQPSGDENARHGLSGLDGPDGLDGVMPSRACRYPALPRSSVRTTDSSRSDCSARSARSGTRRRRRRCGRTGSRRWLGMHAARRRLGRGGSGSRRRYDARSTRESARAVPDQFIDD